MTLVPCAVTARILRRALMLVRHVERMSVDDLVELTGIPEMTLIRFEHGEWRRLSGEQFQRLGELLGPCLGDLAQIDWETG
jgi:DNA-binding Xre family transcriptional regulator